MLKKNKKKLIRLDFIVFPQYHISEWIGSINKVEIKMIFDTFVLGELY